MQNIFFSFSFSEHTQLVDHISHRIEQSVLLSHCDFKPAHLARNEAYKDDPLQNSLKQIRNAHYVVCLIGSNLGSEAKDGKTYIELEIEEALKSDADGVFLFLVGEKYSGKLKDINFDDPRIPLLLNNLSKHITFGTITSHEDELIARTVVSTLERDVWQSLGDADDIRFDKEPLNVSGFHYLEYHRLPDVYVKQLEHIYKLESISVTSTPLHQNHYQRKKWALESLKLSETTEALKNLEKALEDFSTDLFACFWAGRLLAINGTTPEQWQCAVEYSKRAIKIANRLELPLIEALCLVHQGSACAKLGEYDTASILLKTALELQPRLFDAHYHMAILYLMRANTEPNQALYFRKLATDALHCTIRVRMQFYLSIRDSLAEQFEIHFPDVEKELLDRMANTYKGINRSLAENTYWAQEQLGVNIRHKPLPTKGDLLQMAFNASKSVWRNYLLLSRSSHVLVSAHYEITARQKYCAERIELLKRAQLELNSFASRTNQWIADKNDKKKKLIIINAEQTKKEKARNYSTWIAGAFFVGLFTMLINEQTNFAYIPALAGVTLFLYSRNCHTKAVSCSKQITELKHSVDKITDSFICLRDRLFLYGADIEQINKTSTSGLVNFESLTCDELATLTEALSNDIRDEKNNIHQTTERLKNEYKRTAKLAYEWCQRTDSFETYSISAHNGQYVRNVLKKGGCEVVKASEAEYGSFTQTYSGRSADKNAWTVLTRNGFRLDAYTNELPDAEQALTELTCVQHENFEPEVTG